MHTFINKQNQFSVSFAGCPVLVSQVPAPSLSEIIREARQTGQMPYTSQRTPVPSYTNDLDAQQFFDGCDRIAGQVNAIHFSDTIRQLEAKLSEDQRKLTIQNSDKPAVVNDSSAVAE